MQSTGVALVVVAAAATTTTQNTANNNNNNHHHHNVKIKKNRTKKLHTQMLDLNETDSKKFKDFHNSQQGMEAGVVKIAEDSDFYMLKNLVDDHRHWKLEYDKGEEIRVWTKLTSNSSFKMVKVQSVFQNIRASTMFDVLHDPDYRKDWDEHMMSSIEIGYLNPNNDVGYYALSCPPPVKNRDFVLQRSWLDTDDEKLILNHSVEHKDYPQRKGFIRATSYLTGFVIRPVDNGCFLGYVSQTDPRGQLPSWLVNKITQKFAPKVVKRLRKAAEGYESWKTSQPNPDFKPWIYAELTLLSRRIALNELTAQYYMKNMALVIDKRMTI